MYIRNMNKFTFIASVCFGFFFAACGDDSSSATRPSEESSSSVALSLSSSSSVILGFSSVTLSEVEGSLTDTRDGQSYKTVVIGSQTWMAENLNYHIGKSYSYCYDNDVNNCAKYGLLYTWAAAKKACPRGWHLPTKTEFETLFNTVVGESEVGVMLKSTSGWGEYDRINGNGTDAYSFSALPAGYRDSNGVYGLEGYYAYFWSSTEDRYGRACNVFLCYNYDAAYLGYGSENFWFSVRCVKD